MKHGNMDLKYEKFTEAISENIMSQKATANILLVDDEETFLLSTADLIKKNGYNCDKAADYDSAIKLLRKNRYHLLISDIKMPGNHDLKLIKESAKLSAELPVIIVTAYPSVDTAVMANDFPIVAYLVKPIEINELLKYIKRAVDLSLLYDNFDRTQQRLQKLTLEFDSIKQRNIEDGPVSTHLTVQKYLEMTFKNIVQSIEDVSFLMNNLFQDKMDSDVCSFFSCPKEKIFTDTIYETIKVLEKTKNSFKSKELAELRKKLESIELSKNPNNASISFRVGKSSLEK